MGVSAADLLSMAQGAPPQGATAPSNAPLSAAALLQMAKGTPQTPYKPLPDAQALAVLQKSGALQDPGMAAFVQQHGPSAALAASQGHGAFTPQNIAQAGYQAQYNAMPWYEKAAVGLGRGIDDSAHALAGSALTVGNKLGLVSNQTLDKYKQGVADQQAAAAPIENAVARSNPLSSFAWQYTGQNVLPVAAAAFGGAPELGAKLGLTGIPLVASRVAGGALEGGLIGSLTPTQDQNYTRNMTIGAITGGAFPVLMSGAGSILDGGKNVAQFLAGKGAQETLAGTGLRDAAGGTIPALSGRPIPQVEGFNPTVGQLTNNPGLVQLERAVRAKGELGASLAAQEGANNTAIHAAIGKLAPEVSPMEASAAARDALESERAAAKGAERDAWNQIPEGVTFPTTDLKAAIDASLRKLPKAYRRLVPEEIPNLVGSLEDHEPLPELQAVRSRIGELADQARVAGDVNKARILWGLQDHVDSAIDPTKAVLGNGVTPEQFQNAYDNAMDTSRDLHARFDGRPISQVLKQGAPGPAVQPSQTLQTALRNGTPEGVAALSKAIGNNEEGRQAVRDYLVNAMRQYGATASQDAAGHPMLSSAKLGKFLNDHDAAINEFFEPQQVDAIKQIHAASQMNDNVMRGGARIGGSDTANKLSQGNVLGLLTKAKGILGLAGLPGDIANFGIGKIAGGAQYGLDSILTRAMSDPEYADMLMQKATPGNVQRFMRAAAHALQPVGRALVVHHQVVGGNRPTTTGSWLPTLPPVLLHGAGS